jgi:hypothetical protein
MFPANWDPTHAQSKRRKTFIQQCEEDACSLTSQVAFSSGLQQTILRRLNANDGPQEPQPIQMDHILSRVPYKSMLENMFPNADPPIKNVPILTRAYEESFMRQAMPGERSCAMGDMCECMQIDKSNPFIGVEMRLPNDPEETQMCVLCSRCTTQKCFYDMCYLARPVTAVIQRYGCMYGQPNEYAAECMLIPPRSIGPAFMPAPSVSHQRNRYSVVMQSGIKHLKQHRVGYEDFCPPSARDAA